MKHPRTCFLGICLFGLALAWHNRFVLDDAFISFTYARSLCEGGGLSWFGTRIEGYSNFLWVLWVSLGLCIGQDPILWAHLGSLACFLVVLHVMWRLVLILFDATLPRIAALALFVTNYTMSSYATSGLETMLQTMALSIAALQFYEVQRRPTVSSLRLAGFSLAIAVAVLTRMDSALPALVLCIWGILHLYRRRCGAGTYLAAALPFALLVGCWLAWKLSYYGSLLPNSFDAKVAWSWGACFNGLIYLSRFFHWYLLWPWLLLGILAFLMNRRRSSHGLAPMWSVMALWCLYVVAVGGDFMEFRFLVPIAPFLFITMAHLMYYGWSARLAGMRTGACVLMVLVVGCCSYRHATTFTGVTNDRTLDSIAVLKTFYGLYVDDDWSSVGDVLRSHLPDSDVIIACHGAGAIPYYSRLKTVDMYGLNDPYIPLHGRGDEPAYSRPGHQVYATLGYLREAGVNLIIGDPRLFRRGMVSHPTTAGLCRDLIASTVVGNREPIDKATAVAMPLDQQSALFMWYLTPHPDIDRLIDSGEWESKVVCLSR